jgi:predicted DNA-binding WGR domain protein
MKQIRLENNTGNSNKFYEMEEQNNGEFIAKWGRIGNSIYPQQKVYPMSDWDKVKNSKINKGYHKIPSKSNGSHMKYSQGGKRLKDVLDDKSIDRVFWDNMFSKLKTLQDKIEATNPSIDDPELRWVSDRIEYWLSEERLLTPQEMSVANHYWKKYK